MKTSIGFVWGLLAVMSLAGVARAEDEPEDVSANESAVPGLEPQLQCVLREGGCAPVAGVPNDDDVAKYDAGCRGKSGYKGPTLTVKDLDCEHPGMAIARSLEPTYPGWLKVIPACPCDAPKDDDVWESSNTLLQTYHPGATTSYRTKKGYASVPGSSHGQQCTYDKEDKLITSGAAAGTPDAWSPATDFWKHNTTDVEPWKHLGWSLYDNYWEPDNRNDCPANKI